MDRVILLYDPPGVVLRSMWKPSVSISVPVIQTMRFCLSPVVTSKEAKVMAVGFSANNLWLTWISQAITPGSNATFPISKPYAKDAGAIISGAGTANGRPITAPAVVTLTTVIPSVIHNLPTVTSSAKGLKAIPYPVVKGPIMSGAGTANADSTAPAVVIFATVNPSVIHKVSVTGSCARSYANDKGAIISGAGTANGRPTTTPAVVTLTTVMPSVIHNMPTVISSAKGLKAIPYPVLKSPIISGAGTGNGRPITAPAVVTLATIMPSVIHKVSVTGSCARSYAVVASPRISGAGTGNEDSTAPAVVIFATVIPSVIHKVSVPIGGAPGPRGTAPPVG